jgi:hypothetical protein
MDVPSQIKLPRCPAVNLHSKEIFRLSIISEIGRVNVRASMPGAS